MADPFLGQIMQVGWGFVNTGWANCNGALIPISQNSALFALLGTTFGGNGTQTFGLPDVQGRVLIGQGQGQGLSNYIWGQKAGTESTTLNVSNLPAHNHTATVTGLTGNQQASNAPASQSTPQNNYWLAESIGGGSKIYAPTAPTSPNAAVNLAGLVISGGTVNVGLTGGSQPFPTLQPYLAVWTLIAMSGVFPTRG